MARRPWRALAKLAKQRHKRCPRGFSVHNWYDVNSQRPTINFEWSPKACTEQARDLKHISTDVARLWESLSSRSRVDLSFCSGDSGGDAIKIQRVPASSLTAMEFYVNYVSKGIPVILTGLADDWPARSWSNNYLINAMGDKKVLVDVSPTGITEQVIGGQLVRSRQQRMKLASFLQHLESSATTDAGECFYLQSQHDNLNHEFSPLSADVPKIHDLELASGLIPRATNIWVGGPHSVSSLHFDMFENLNTVVSGSKEWLLFPPTDLPFFYFTRFPEAKWSTKISRDGGVDRFNPKLVDPTNSSLHPWIPVDPDFPDYSVYPRSRNALPSRVVVEEGETIFIPATYLHQVCQTPSREGRAISVNYWFEMHNPQLKHLFSFMVHTDSLIRRYQLDRPGAFSTGPV